METNVKVSIPDNGGKIKNADANKFNFIDGTYGLTH